MQTIRTEEEKRSTYAHLHLLPKTKATKKGKSAGTHTKRREKKDLTFCFAPHLERFLVCCRRKSLRFVLKDSFFPSVLHHRGAGFEPSQLLFIISRLLLLCFFFSLLLLSLFCSHLLTRHVALGQGDKYLPFLLSTTCIASSSLGDAADSARLAVYSTFTFSFQQSVLLNFLCYSVRVVFPFFFSLFISTCASH